MTDSLKKLYNRLILERQNDPAGFQKREDADAIIEAYNPVCGDKFNLYLNFEGDTISDASYHGYGCALSKASTSILIEGLPGKTFSECVVFVESYYKNLQKVPEGADDLINALALARNFPGREQCTVLSWEAILRYIKEK
jgi:nitrogen fixation NifU-like protein